MTEIRETPMGGDLKDFLEVVEDIYRADPNYVRALDLDLKDRLNPKKNPFFEHGEGTTFTAYKAGRCVGRITAQIDRGHLERYKDDTGFFGFLDTVDEPDVARELLSAAERWLKSRGMKKVRGPLSLNINEELGVLVEGFDTPPYFMMPHHLPYQGGLVEQAGYVKEKDFYAWKYTVGDLNARTRKAHAEIAAMPEVTGRPMSMKHMQRDVDIIVDVFNDAWSDNWGFVPATKKEVQKMAEDFKLILIPDITRIVTIDGEPAAVALALPNLNELIADLHGKLFPFGIAKLLWRLKVKGPKSGRLVILGIRKKWRHVRKYAALSAYLYAEMNDAGRKIGMTKGELSWTLEDNAPVNTGIKVLGSQIYKRYRLYTKELA